MEADVKQKCCSAQREYDEIESLRQQMIQTAMALGMNHPKVLDYSQRIDQCHNRLLKHHFFS